MTSAVTRIGITAAYVAIVLLFMLAGRAASNLLFRSRKVHHSPNLAMSVRHGGLYLAVAIAMTAALQGTTGGFVADVFEVLRDGGVIVFALIVAQKINDWCIGPGLDNDQAEADGNTAVALTEFGSYLGTGMIASASFGEGDGSWLTAIAFFAIGQAALIAGFWAQERLLPRSFLGAVRRGHAGAGIAVAGVMIALGVILRASVAGPFLGWAASLRSLGIYAIGGILFLLAFQEVFTFAFANRRYIEDPGHDMARSCVAACGQIGLALVITALF